MVVSQAQRVIRREDGSEIAEFAMVVPIVFMMFFAVFWFGQAFRIYTTINHAARLGATAAVRPVCATCAPVNDPAQNAYNAVQGALVAAHMNPANLQRPGTPPGVCPCGNPNTVCPSGTVTCASTQTSICVQGAQQVGGAGPAVESDVNLSSAVFGGTGVCGLSVSFQYPFQFTLPGTSLNLQTVNLPAQAEMRSESH